MKVFSAYRDGRLTVYLQGELDHHGVIGSMEAIEQLLDSYMPRDVVLNLSTLKFMDSSGIALILKLHRRQQSVGGRAWVENPAEQPMRVIDASGIDRLINVVAKEETSV